MTMPVDAERITRCYATVRDALLAERNADGHWTGELSTSALSTATAVMALQLVRRDRRVRGLANGDEARLSALVEAGLAWLAEHQNDDGGWGDTTKSFSNISTTMLARATFHACEADDRFHRVIVRAAGYIHRMGGVEAVVARYGKDRTFSVPILTHCALAGMVEWRDVPALPFELACLPPQFYKTVRLPVVSYALPALIAIGQVRHFHRKCTNPALRAVRRFSIKPSLRVLERIQPENGGFLEAAPLTSFVTMSLAGMGLSDHLVAVRGTQFLIDSMRDDGSWPIDTNLATWVTTMSANALGDDLPEADRPAICDWLLGQQYREVHPYTNADPGGWAWTDLPGGVPDADDTPGAMLALLNLTRGHEAAEGGRLAPRVESARGASRPPWETTPPARPDDRIDAALANGIGWLLGLQNGDGGFPTFCRGWGTLPFDRSAPDITAHCIRAIMPWLKCELGVSDVTFPEPGIKVSWKWGKASPASFAIFKGFEFLGQVQRPDGSWLPLWFGNQHAANDENPVYGTARVLAAYRDAGRLEAEPARRGLNWLTNAQNADGGWGGTRGTPSTVEETALAVEILLSADPAGEQTHRGVAWLLDRVEDGSFCEPSPIGFYFAKLWYFEKLYPLALMVAALRRAQRVLVDGRDDDRARTFPPETPQDTPAARRPAGSR